MIIDTAGYGTEYLRWREGVREEEREREGGRVGEEGKGKGREGREDGMEREGEEVKYVIIS